MAAKREQDEQPILEEQKFWTVRSYKGAEIEYLTTDDITHVEDPRTEIQYTFLGIERDKGKKHN